MGIPLYKLDALRTKGILRERCKVLDIGSSNLYSADADPIHAFLRGFGVTADAAFVEGIARGSAYGPNGGLNESWVGELLERAGIEYLALDIANGYRTRIFDLNNDSLPRRYRRYFDVVLNFGTTEHVINQLNALSVIHDAAKPGGYIVHELPTLGYLDHGYFAYTPRLFFDLCGYNEYELIEFLYQGPQEAADIANIVRDYKKYFPALRDSINFVPQNVSSYVVFRKVKDRPLRLPLEKSTSVTR